LLTPRIAIITDDPGWQGRELKRAFAERHWESHYVSLPDCRIDLHGPAAQIILPGFDGRLPDGVFVRGVSGGTLEQVIFRLDVLHALRELDVVVYNDARAIERTVDKAMTSFLLKRAGIPSPMTWVCESPEQARAIAIHEHGCGRALVLKPLFGSQGEGIVKIDEPGQLLQLYDFKGIYYLQEFIDKPAGDWHDWRVLVIAGRAVAAMVRRSRHWITNRAQGGYCEPALLEPRLTELAEAAARAVDIDYAGVDLILDSEHRYLVTEVNSIPAWRGLQSVCSGNIAGWLADHFLAKVAAQSRTEAVS
jgi:RimK family alpha-L-glutamate ligase